MSKQYGHSNKSTGRSSSINEHPSQVKQDKEHHSNMNIVDLKEHHQKTIANMSASPKHVGALNISDKVPYKRQSHAVRPEGDIKSFVGSRVDGNFGAEPSVKRPGDGKGYYPKDKKGSS